MLTIQTLRLPALLFLHAALVANCCGNSVRAEEPATIRRKCLQAKWSLFWSSNAWIVTIKVPWKVAST